jgi:hypothetical protein
MSVELTTHAMEKSTYVITVAFTDEDGAAVIPTAATWTLTDASGTVINSRTGVAMSPLASTYNIVLSGLDLAMQTGETLVGQRLLTVQATYNSTLGTGLPLKAEVKFIVDGLVVVT